MSLLHHSNLKPLTAILAMWANEQVPRYSQCLQHNVHRINWTSKERHQLGAISVVYSKPQPTVDNHRRERPNDNRSVACDTNSLKAPFSI